MFFSENMRKVERKWAAQITIDGKAKHLGHYDDEKQAALAYDAEITARKLNKDLNFPNDLGRFGPENRYAKRQESSKYYGVSWKTRQRKWWAQIKIDGKTKHLGYFEDEKDAALAYDKKVTSHKLNRPRNSDAFPDDFPEPQKRKRQSDLSHWIHKESE
eukprot:COSAG05_NODE_327_length_11345_cov_16.236884_6_plen_159_part_00